MMMNQAADSWAQAQGEAKQIAAGLKLGDYWLTWDDEEPSDSIAAEVGRALDGRGMRLVSDDRGLRVGVGAGAIRKLRDDAAVAGDDEQIRLCDRALAGDDGAWRKCERAIGDAQAMQD